MKPAKVMLIDDSVEILRLLTELVKRCSYSPMPATSGRIALDALGKSTPDLIFLDLNLPDMSGLDICKSIRAQGLTNVPIIIMTGSLDEGDENNVFDAGANRLISKPFSNSIFMEMLEYYLQEGQ